VEFHTDELSEFEIGEDYRGRPEIEKQIRHVKAEPGEEGRFEVNGSVVGDGEETDYTVEAPITAEPEDIASSALGNGHSAQSYVEVKVWDVEAGENIVEELYLGELPSKLPDIRSEYDPGYINELVISKTPGSFEQVIWSMRGEHSPGIVFMTREPGSVSPSAYFLEDEDNVTSEEAGLGVEVVFRKLESYDLDVI